jgi:hypothetical protein
MNLIASLAAPRSREFEALDTDADVVTVELGSHWELEAAGMVLDWSRFPPRPVAGAPSRPPTGGRVRALTSAIRDAGAAMPAGKLVAASLIGPGLASAEVAAAASPAPGVGTASAATRVRAPAGPAPWSGGATLGGARPHDDAATSAFAGAFFPPAGTRPGPPPPVAPAVVATFKAAAAALCEAGAGLIWIVEDPRRAVAAKELVPLLAAIQAQHVIPALLLAGAADEAWLDVARSLRQAVVCVDPALSPELAALPRRAHGFLEGGDRVRISERPLS